MTLQQKLNNEIFAYLPELKKYRHDHFNHILNEVNNSIKPLSKMNYSELKEFENKLQLQIIFKEMDILEEMGVL